MMLCVNSAQLLLVWFQVSFKPAPLSVSSGLVRFLKPLSVNEGPAKIPSRAKAASTGCCEAGRNGSTPAATVRLKQVGVPGARRLSGTSGDAAKFAAIRQLA